MLSVSILSSASESPAMRLRFKDSFRYASLSSISALACFKTDMEIISSPLASFAPRTPVELRLANTRIAETGNLMHLPSLAARRISCPSSQTTTPIKESPSSSFMAILPLDLTSTKSESLFLRTPPLAVANITYLFSHSASLSGRRITVVMVSPCSSGKMLIIALPIEVGEPSGSLYTFCL